MKMRLLLAATKLLALGVCLKLGLPRPDFFDG